MRIRTAQLAFFGLFLLILGASPGAQAQHRRAPTRARTAALAKLDCGDYVAFQVLLDRQGFSSGQIDGKPGVNFTHALHAFQSARQLTESGAPDCDTWNALSSDVDPTVTSYTVTANDVKGPFETIPADAAKQAALPALGYQSALEEIAERFHASPALLREMNHGAAIEEGREIRVPAVKPFDPGAKPAADAPSGGVTIRVTRDDSALRALCADGTVVFFAPVSSGSVHDPLPPGDWKVTGVSWHPTFHYNPDLFWDAKEGDAKATIKPGPNNPVGVVWIALNLDHYGIHGTPEPGRVGHAESHGCVRLTNWDAARVAALVKPGTPVQFR